MGENNVCCECMHLPISVIYSLSLVLSIVGSFRRFVWTSVGFYPVPTFDIGCS